MDADAIQQIAKDTLPGNIRILVRKELKKLPGMLGESEQVLKLGQGRYEGKQGLVIATDHRVLFIDEGLVSSRREDFPYERISSVQQEKGMMFGALTVFASGNKAVIDQIAPKERAGELADLIRSRQGGKPAGAANEGPSEDSALDKLKKLGELKDAGTISEEEFEQKKTKLMEEL